MVPPSTWSGATDRQEHPLSSLRTAARAALTTLVSLGLLLGLVAFVPAASAAPSTGAPTSNQQCLDARDRASASRSAYGQAVAAVVQLRDGATLELEELREYLRAHLSGYKLPRSLTVVDTIPRNATGKAQYPAAKEMALASQAEAATAG